ncbi:response regulatory protein [Paenibacillus mucilaginosus 3016]|uniref:Response regulatory protein n=1 Tax=Paenibacillus mucilaginosus 3016 TaxID=1116391 RepID=H6NE01_9BACL|nr:response regulator [Paenibacillus mucilaginosus]AFC32954.1 response regulatory protein [Paenibacillus mucilaginosus 3016]
MIAIIVDDEKHVREAIKLLVPWEEFGITRILEAQDGLDAADLIAEHRPQLIFTDMMMPLRSGTELLDWLQLHYPEGKTIVISGHDDFEFVRHTVKSGGIDYILKPIDAQQLYKAVDKAVTAWKREEAERLLQTERNIERNQFKPVYWEKMLSGLTAEPSGYEACSLALQQEFGLSTGVSSCRVAILSLDTMSSVLRRKFDKNTDLLYFSLTNIANEVLKEGSRAGIAYRYWNSDNEVLILLYDRLETAEELLHKIQQSLLVVLQSTLDIGLSLVQDFPKGLPAAYEEARRSLRARNLLSRTKGVHVYSPQGAPAHKLLAFSAYAESVQLAVRSGSADQIRRVVGEWIAAVRELPSIDVEQLEETSPQSGGGSGERSPFIVPLDEHGALSLDQWEQQLTADLIELSRQLLTQQHQDSNVIFEISKYIQSHYHQDITLQEIASHFFLSREYISRKFKQEFGVNLSDYVSGIRIDKAKLLLLNPHLRVSQVAEMVGYEDEKYFSKVFKKMVGSSPNEYRKVNPS